MSALTDAARRAATDAARRLGPADSIVAGILDLAIARPLALDALLSVASIEWSAEVTTACIECADRPRLLLNPSFVEQSCSTRERLAALILHELSHVSLGHTRLFPRLTFAHNLAFDAIINSSLLLTLERLDGGAGAYGALFESCYSANESPWFILRSPPGWPGVPDWRASDGLPDALRDAHRRLYRVPVDPVCGGETHDVTYADILHALRGDVCFAAEGDASHESSGLLARLLGGHGVTDLERAAQGSGRDAHAADALRPLVTALSIASGPMAGPGAALHDLMIARRARERPLEHAIERLLRRVLVGTEAGAATRSQGTVSSLSVDPSRDRRAAVRRHVARRLGTPTPLLWTHETEHVRRQRGRAAVYLDVSGSMNGTLDRLHAALVPLRRQLAASCHLFSTEVVDVGRDAFARGRLQTTGGTSIDPVLCHAADASRAGRVKRVLVLTDGHFNPPTPEALAALQHSGVAVHLGVIGAGPLHTSQPWVASATRLPPASAQ